MIFLLLKLTIKGYERSSILSLIFNCAGTGRVYVCYESGTGIKVFNLSGSGRVRVMRIKIQRVRVGYG